MFVRLGLELEQHLVGGAGADDRAGGNVRHVQVAGEIRGDVGGAELLDLQRVQLLGRVGKALVPAVDSGGSVTDAHGWGELLRRVALRLCLACGVGHADGLRGAVDLVDLTADVACGVGVGGAVGGRCSLCPALHASGQRFQRNP